MTGALDSLACFTKMGIDPNEFGDSSSSDKRIIFYTGSGGASPGSQDAAPDNEKCGGVVYAGMHTSYKNNDVDASFPAGCSTGLESDEKALIFLLFDLGSCTGVIN